VRNDRASAGIGCQEKGAMQKERRGMGPRLFFDFQFKLRTVQSFLGSGNFNLSG
jgi:hypothetical protein